MKKITYWGLFFCSAILFSCTSPENVKNAQGTKDETYDTTGGVSKVTSDSSSASSTNPTHLDENNDQRGTRIKAGTDSSAKK